MKWHDGLHYKRVPGATDDDINRFVKAVFSPLTDIEVNELTEEHKRVVGDGHFDPPFCPEEWKFPSRPIPNDYLSFLRWSNGGYFQGVNRDLDPLFASTEVRDYMLGYSIPHWMPETCPIGFDGGGGFYLLDMRSPAQISECPILWAHAVNLSFADAEILATSFSEFIGTTLGTA